MKKLTILTLVVLFFAACSEENMEPSSIGTPSAKTILPFTATINAAADANPAIPQTACSGDLPGFSAPDFLLSGNANHLGLLNATSRLHHDDCNLSFATMLLTTNVTVDLVAANGDVVHCTGTDVVNVAALLTQTGTTGSITGTWTINGGTGRFANATGTCNINGTVDFATNAFSCVCTGSIAY